MKSNLHWLDSESNFLFFHERVKQTSGMKRNRKAGEGLLSYFNFYFDVNFEHEHTLVFIGESVSRAIYSLSIIGGEQHLRCRKRCLRRRNGVCDAANAVCDAANAVCDAANGRGATPKFHEKRICRSEGPANFFLVCRHRKVWFRDATNAVCDDANAVCDAANAVKLEKYLLRNVTRVRSTFLNPSGDFGRSALTPWLENIEILIQVR